MNIIFTSLTIFIIFCILKLVIQYIKDIHIISKFSINKVNEKLASYRFFKKFLYYLLQFNNTKNIKIKVISPLMLIVISIVFSSIIFVIAYKIFDIFSTAFVISFFSLCIPYMILKMVIKMQKSKILKTFPTYIMNLKNYIETKNDIVVAFRMATVEGPLSIFIDKFNVSVSSGMSIYECFENLKNDINIKKITEFITALEYCYINGGDFSKLLQRYSKILSKINLQQEKEREENFSAKVVLGVLIVINVYMLFAFAYGNVEYRQIMTHTFLGQVIVNLNVLSYIIILFFMYKINRVEE